MKRTWKSILTIAFVGVGVGWFLSGFSVEGLGFWLRLAGALIVGGVLVSPVLGIIEKRFGEGPATLAGYLLLPEVVLALHFIVFPWAFGV